MCFLCIRYKYKKWFTLLGCMLVHLSLGSNYTFGNMCNYFTSYIREIDDEKSIRYAQTGWVPTINSVMVSVASVIGTVLNLKYKINIRIIVLIGCVFMR